MKKFIIPAAFACGVATLFGIGSANAKSNNYVHIIDSNKVSFIKRIDREMGTEFSSLINEPLAYHVLDVVQFACGNKGLQERFMIAAGGSRDDAEYASTIFEREYCGQN